MKYAIGAAVGAAVTAAVGLVLVGSFAMALVEAQRQADVADTV